MSDMYADQLKFVPLEVAAVPPPGLIEHIKDAWWTYCPQRGIAFYRGGPKSNPSARLYPQCNRSESISRKLTDQSWPGLETIFVPSVFRRINVSDYT